MRAVTQSDRKAKQGARETPRRLRGLLRAGSKLLLLVLLCAAASLLALESVYRLQLVDTYRGELREYNPATDMAGSDSRPTVLLMGDSLTAGNRSYPTLVRQARSDLRVINAGIPGSCVLQANLVAPARFARFRPSVFVYQVNVGNDLVNLRYPIHWGRLSPVRNLYWTVAHRARSLEYMNYKAGQAVRSARYEKAVHDLQAAGRALADVTDTGCRYDFDDFDPRSYTARIRLYLEAEPALYENQILVGETRRREYERLLDGLRRIFSLCEPPDCAPHLLVIPHASQVDPGYLHAMRQMGARFERPEAVASEDYPFIAGIRAFLVGNGLGHVRVLDPLPALRDVERDRHAYYLHDPHLTACGQEAVARFLLATALRR